MIEVRDIGAGKTLRGHRVDSIMHREYGRNVYLRMEPEPLGQTWHRAAVVHPIPISLGGGESVRTIFYWED